MLDNYADVIVIRHPREGSAKLAAKLASHPVINGGDGANEHPTQALMDLYTIRKEKGKIAGLNIVLFGDLKHARAMHSLLYGLAMFGANITLISPKGMEPSREIIDEITRKFKARVSEKTELDFAGADVIYVTRVQEERFADKYEAKKVKEQFRLELPALENAKKDVIVLHPLPKIDEISAEVDRSRHARYFGQAANAVPVRMAVIDYCMEGGK
ncbi:Aspartate carbamoyltransferase [uncultured archaeon]|nr:Aspartate carbamoyltransferase [uncultured archaeon]